MSSPLESVEAAMSIGTKIILVLGAVVVVYLGLSFAVLRTFINPVFDDLESEFAREDLARIEYALEGLAAQMYVVNIEWSQWTDARDFLQGSNPNFIEEEATNFDHEAARIDTFILSDLDGEIIWSSSTNLATGELESAEDLFGAPLHTLNELIARAMDPDIVGSLVRTHRGPALVSAQPVLTSAGAGPPAGTSILLRVLDREQLDDLRESIQVDFNLSMVKNGAPLPSGFELGLQAGDEPHTQVTETMRVAFKPILDIYGEPVFLLRVKSPRHITSVGSRAVSLALIALVLGGAILTLAIWIILQRMIISPISALTRSMLSLAAELSGPERQSQAPPPEPGEGDPEGTEGDGPARVRALG